MPELNDIELQLLERLTIKYPSLKSHISHLKVTGREKTGSGMHIDFEYVDFNEKTQPLNSLFSTEEKLSIPKLEHGLGYVIDITDGEIKYMEFMTYGENWNGDFKGWSWMEEEEK